jgi:LysR family glycine cleavage system transcriptional activator
LADGPDDEAMHLPSLKALRAFEAAGRHGSLKKAALEMGVTPGAVTKQIQLLEATLGRPLFARSHRAVELTPLGRTYLEEVGGAFARLEQATQRITRADDTRQLRLHCSSMFMQHWLTPRLASLRAAEPTLDVLISVGPARAGLPADADVGIRLGQKPKGGLASHRLLELRLVPICSPAYLAATGPLADAAAFTSRVLLASLIRPEAWRDWLRAAGCAAAPEHLIGFPDASAAYHAALKGAGIALVYEDFARLDLDDGLLVKPFDFAVPSSDAYYLVYPKANAGLARVARFRAWLLAETRRFHRGERPALG